MTESVRTQADIVIEQVSMSTYNFFCADPFVTCKLHNTELEYLSKTIEDSLRSNDERDKLREQFHQLEEAMCPIDRRLQALDSSDEDNLFITIDHSCAGAVDITINLALIDAADFGAQIYMIQERIIDVIANEQMPGENPIVSRITPL